MAGRVELLAERAGRHRAGVGFLLLEAGNRLLANLLQFVGGEDRLADDFGREVEDWCQVLGQ